MIKILLAFIFPLLFFFGATQVYANTNSFVSIVNPVRGEDFWDLKNQKVSTAVEGQIEILGQFNLPATWLLRFDALDDKEIIDILNKRLSDEKGIFLEITKTWTTQAQVEYHESENWHSAGSAFLTGYERGNREKLIDVAFEKFKKVFGYFPTSVGAWWIDSYSLGYMEEKYGISAALIVSDQYTTDNYQIWGQYWSTPFYPSKRNALYPAQSRGAKLPVVMMQWAARDPVNAYGNGVMESTYSVQANDYTDYHDLTTKYFSTLVDIYTSVQFNQFGQLVVGLENSYPWDKYAAEYKNQMQILSDKKRVGQFSVVTMKDFANWYKDAFPNLSPTQIIVTDDPLGSYNKAVWFMNPYFRAGWFINEDGSVFRDIRQYVEGDEEICFQKRCDEVNFATFATRVLDEVTYGHKWVIDEGKISDFKLLKKGNNFVITYLNEAGNLRTIEFLPRDIKVDEKISSIDGTILDAIKQDTTLLQSTDIEIRPLSWSISPVLSKTTRFILFFLFVFLLPGLILTRKLFDAKEATAEKIFLASIVGLVTLTIIFYIVSLLNLRNLVSFYIFISLFIFIKLKLLSYIKYKFPKLDNLSKISLLIIALGTIFQNIPTFRSGLNYSYGLGLWGPNTHDGIWHISLINQLIQGLPVQNPVFADTVLKNYHFFYDLLIAATAYLTRIPTLDLVFRFYPIIFSLALGIGTYFLASKLFKSKISTIFSLYFVYFAGSFGWIVDYIKNKSFGGESAFWANQSISFNLNPPFAISLLIIIAFLLLLSDKKKFTSISGIFISILLVSSLVGFKSYGAVLVMIALTVVALLNVFKKEFAYILVLIFSSFFSLLIFLTNFQASQQLIIFSPFWFIHSMIDSPDRVGWIRLSLAREAGIETKNWFKFASAEAVSLIIFIGGNLGMRVFSLLSLIKIKNIFKDSTLLFIFVFSIFSILIPILLIQSGNPWNTIQFSYYGLYITAVFAGTVLASLIFRLPKYPSILLISGVVILTPINSITTASYYTGDLPHARVGSEELKALEFLSQQEEGTVLTYPYDGKLKRKIAEPWPLFIYDSTAYVSALSKKAVYLEDEIQNQILLTDYKKRLVASKDFFSQRNTNFLAENKIKYIYLPKIFNLSLEEKFLPVDKIFENEDVEIYKVKNNK